MVRTCSGAANGSSSRKRQTPLKLSGLVRSAHFASKSFSEPGGVRPKRECLAYALEPAGAVALPMQQEPAEVQRVGMSGLDREDPFTELLRGIDEAALLQRDGNCDGLVQVELGDRFVGPVGVDQLDVGRLGRFSCPFGGKLIRWAARIG